MASPRQIAASRANGALSRGPKTPEGKLRASGNRCSHGLYSKRPVLKTESQAAFDHLLAEITPCLHPATPVEHALVQRIAIALWRQKRAYELHARIYNSFLPPGPHDPLDAEYVEADTWMRAATEEPAFHASLDAASRHSSQFTIALRTLLREQKARRRNEHSNPLNTIFIRSDLQQNPSAPTTDTAPQQPAQRTKTPRIAAIPQHL